MFADLMIVRRNKQVKIPRYLVEITVDSEVALDFLKWAEHRNLIEFTDSVYRFAFSSCKSARHFRGEAKRNFGASGRLFRIKLNIAPQYEAM